MVSLSCQVAETSTMQLCEEVESAKRELANDRHRLKIAKNMCTSIEHDRSIVEEAR